MSNIMAAFVDELVIDPISGEQITPRHAILVSTADDKSDMMEYLRSVGSVVGPKNIRSAYKIKGYVKIYLRYRKHVEEVVCSGVFLQGRYIDVKYCMPPATEVLLENVDTEIPNQALCELLCQYGSLVTKIIIDKVKVEDKDFSHIESNTRRVYMQMNPLAKLPSSLVVMHSHEEYCINVTVNDSAGSHDQTTALPAVIPKENGEFSTGKRLRISDASDNLYVENNGQRRSSLSSAGLRKRGRGRGRSLLKSRKLLKASNTLPRPLPLPPPPEEKHGKPEKMKSKVCRIALVSTPSILSSSNSIASHKDGSAGSSEMSELITKSLSPLGEPPSSRVNGNKDSDSSSETINFDHEHFINLWDGPFDKDTLQLFLSSVKSHRNPREVALKMLKEKSNGATLMDLCKQLSLYSSECDAQKKQRISRLLTLFSNVDP